MKERIHIIVPKLVLMTHSLRNTSSGARPVLRLIVAGNVGARDESGHLEASLVCRGLRPSGVWNKKSYDVVQYHITVKFTVK